MREVSGLFLRGAGGEDDKVRAYDLQIDAGVLKADRAGEELFHAVECGPSDALGDEIRNILKRLAEGLKLTLLSLGDGKEYLVGRDPDAPKVAIVANPDPIREPLRIRGWRQSSRRPDRRTEDQKAGERPSHHEKEEWKTRATLIAKNFFELLTHPRSNRLVMLLEGTMNRPGRGDPCLPVDPSNGFGAQRYFRKDVNNICDMNDWRQIEGMASRVRFQNYVIDLLKAEIVSRFLDHDNHTVRANAGRVEPSIEFIYHSSERTEASAHLVLRLRKESGDWQGNSAQETKKEGWWPY